MGAGLVYLNCWVVQGKFQSRHEAHIRKNEKHVGTNISHVSF